MKKFQPRHLLGARDEYVNSVSSLFDELFDSAFPEAKDFFGISISKGSYPKVDIINKEKEILIIAELAGWRKQDLDIDVKDNILSIQGKNSSDKNPPEGTYILRELKRSSFKRSFTLGENLDLESIDAEYEDGTLQIYISKKEPEKPTTRKIKL